MVHGFKEYLISNKSKMAASVKAFQAARRHIPLIKFPDRNGKFTNTLKVNAPNLGLSKLSSPSSASPTSPSSHNVKSFRELPPRYRRKPLDQVEIDYIQRGGPE